MGSLRLPCYTHWLCATAQTVLEDMSMALEANFIVLAEFGRSPLHLHWWQHILRYHNRITILSDDFVNAEDSGHTQPER